jgi:hypothetical protein
MKYEMVFLADCNGSARPIAQIHTPMVTSGNCVTVGVFEGTHFLSGRDVPLALCLACQDAGASMYDMISINQRVWELLYQRWNVRMLAWD